MGLVNLLHGADIANVHLRRADTNNETLAKLRSALYFKACPDKTSSAVKVLTIFLV